MPEKETYSRTVDMVDQNADTLVLVFNRLKI